MTAVPARCSSIEAPSTESWKRIREPAGKRRLGRVNAIAFPVQRPEQEHLGLSPIIAAAEEARRENSAVIQHQQIAGLEEPWQLANGAVDQPIRYGIEYEHPGGVALSRRMLRDPLGRQLVIEVSGLHAVEPSPGRLALRSGSTPC